MKALYTIILCLAIATQGYAQTLLAQAKPVGSDNWGYINTKGEFIISPQYRVCNAFGTDGLAAIYEKKEKSFHFIDRKGVRLESEVKEFDLKNIFGFGTKGFEDGLAPVRVGKNWGFLDVTGKLVVKAQYEDINEFNGGFATVKSDGKWLIIDKKGAELKMTADIVDAKAFSEGLAPVRVGDSWGYVSADGNMAIKPQFKSVGQFGNHGLAWAKTETGQVGFIDKQGNWMVEPRFEAAKDLASNGIARVKTDKWMFVDKGGNEISVAQADSYGDFSDGLAYAKTGGKVGFINAQGEMVINQQFDKVRDFKNGYAAAMEGDKWGFIDTKGNWVIEPQFESVKDFEKTSK